MTFSEKLAIAMKDKKISVRELSALTGIPKSAIQRYTSGETEKIPIDRMKLMAEALNIDPAYVMGWDVGKDPNASDEDTACIIGDVDGKKLFFFFFGDKAAEINSGAPNDSAVVRSVFLKTICQQIECFNIAGLEKVLYLLGGLLKEESLLN